MARLTLTERIIPYLLANYPYASGRGLMHGKMGGVLFFFLYARFTGHAIYEEYAEMLMEDIYATMSDDVPVSFETGLCGIGWGIEYMIRHKLIEGDTDEILEDLDRKIMAWNPLRMEDASMTTGLGGILMYVNARIKSYPRKMPFDLPYLKDLEAKAKELVTEDRFVKENIVEFGKLMSGMIDYGSLPSLPPFLFGQLPVEIKNVSDYPLGIHNGLTGVILKDIII